MIDLNPESTGKLFTETWGQCDQISFQEDFFFPSYEKQNLERPERDQLGNFLVTEER